MSKRIVQLALALLGLGVLVYAFLPKPVSVDLASVQRSSLQVTVDQDGTTRIKERYVVSAPLFGRLQRITLKADDVVERGRTRLAVIEPPAPALLDARSHAEAEARVKAGEAATQRTRAELERARTAYEFAKAELERAAQLRQTGGISPQEFDRAEQQERLAADTLKSGQFAVQIAQFELELARATLASTLPQQTGAAESPRLEIPAPIDGRVLRVFQESATVVMAGTPLLEVGDPADLEVQIDVLSQDAVKIKPGAQVRLEHWGGPQPLAARVRRIEPAAFTKVSALGVEEQRVWVIADLTDPVAERPTLGDGYRVEARILIWEDVDVLTVPTGALFRQGEEWAVFLGQNGRAQLRRLKIGHSNGVAAEVLEGLAEGDQVILYPTDKIKDATRIVQREG